MRCSTIGETLSTLKIKYCLVSINGENCQKGMRKCSNGRGNNASGVLFFGEHAEKNYLTISSTPPLSRLRTSTNVLLKRASDRKKIIVKAFREGHDNIETQEGKHDRTLVFSGQKATRKVAVNKKVSPICLSQKPRTMCSSNEPHTAANQ